MYKEFAFREKLLDARDYIGYLSSIRDELGGSSEVDPVYGMAHYTRMNLKRMERWNKTAALHSEVAEYFSSLKQPLDFLVITEAWCGDAAHVLPAVQKITELNASFSMKTLLRDEHPDLMEAYLTDGKKSIPIVIALMEENDKFYEVFRWGPKPRAMMDFLRNFRNGELKISKEEFLLETQHWYNRDKTQSVQFELMELAKTHLPVLSI